MFICIIQRGGAGAGSVVCYINIIVLLQLISCGVTESGRVLTQSTAGIGLQHLTQRQRTDRGIKPRPSDNQITRSAS